MLKNGESQAAETSGNVEDPRSSAYSQVTIDSTDSRSSEPTLVKHKNRFVTSTNDESSTSSVRRISPDKKSSPSPPAKPHNASRSPGLRTRFADPTSAEQSPIATRMSTVPEDFVPNGEEPAKARKSVQFSRDAPEINEPADDTEEEVKNESKAPSLYSRLRALASTQGSHVRTTSGLSFKSQDNRDDTNDAIMSATIDDELTDADADEESGAEAAFSPAVSKKKRKFARRRDEIESAPSSPHNNSRPDLHLSQSSRFLSSQAAPQLPRRITDPDLVAGVSEDEGRRKLEQTLSAWTPRHPLRGLSHGGQRERTPEGTYRRPLNLLSLHTGSSREQSQQPGTGTPDESKPRRRVFPERGTTLTGAKWKQIKNGLRAFSKPKPKEKMTADQAKSAELVAELAAASPAALMIASTFLRDEHDGRRIPALLEQLKVTVTDSETSSETDGHIVFRIELEYGNGINRMKWVIRRALKDFVNITPSTNTITQQNELRVVEFLDRSFRNFPKVFSQFSRHTK